MKKDLFIIIGIFLIIIAILFYFYCSAIRLNKIAQNTNSIYEKYTKNAIQGSTLMTLINKATDHNEKNNVEKNKENNYINNDKNSIKIEIKFLESDKTFPMERISSLGSEQFIKNYSNMKFECTKKEYHKQTNSIKYMLFEQIE